MKCHEKLKDQEELSDIRSNKGEKLCTDISSEMKYLRQIGESWMVNRTLMIHDKTAYFNFMSANFQLLLISNSFPICGSYI